MNGYDSVNGIECVVNISEGKNKTFLDVLANSCAESLLDVHTDRYHNRSVFTLFGSNLFQSVKLLATTAVETLDITKHSGIHPRIGVLDVVPFCPLGTATIEQANDLRNNFAHWLWDNLGVPSFLYGDEKSLPDIRRLLRETPTANPDIGSSSGHPTAGYCAVGARYPLVAYNMILDADIEQTKVLAKRLRSADIRTLALNENGQSQLSFNLINPTVVGPLQVIQMVKNYYEILGTELVGLIPANVIQEYSSEELAESGIAPSCTLEYRVKIQKQTII